MARLENNIEFLNNFVVLNLRKKRTEIKKLSEEETKTLFEIFFNINSIPFNTKEEKKLSKYKSVLKSFLKRKWTIKKLKTFFFKQVILVGVLVSLVVSKVSDGVLCSILSNG